MGKADNTLLAPVEALGVRAAQSDKDGAKAYKAQVWKNGKIEDRVVQTGLNDRKLTEVRSGLAVGEQLIIGRKKPQPPDQGGGFRGGARL